VDLPKYLQSALGEEFEGARTGSFFTGMDEPLKVTGNIKKNRSGSNCIIKDGIRKNGVLKAVEVTSDLPGASIKSLLVEENGRRNVTEISYESIKKQKRFSRSNKKFHPSPA